MPSKHFKQVIAKLLKLLEEPYPQDMKQIKVSKVNYLRVDIGEYRIVYKISGETLSLVLIDKRNDDTVNKLLGRK